MTKFGVSLLFITLLNSSPLLPLHPLIISKSALSLCFVEFCQFCNRKGGFSKHAPKISSLVSNSRMSKAYVWYWGTGSSDVLGLIQTG